MKKILFLAAIAAAGFVLADFPAPMPTPIQKSLVEQAVRRANAYTDEKITAAGSDMSAITNDVEALKTDVAALQSQTNNFATKEDLNTVGGPLLEGLEAVSSNLNESVETINTTLGTHWSRIIDNRDAVLDLTDDVGALKSGKADADEVLSALSALETRLRIIEKTYASKETSTIVQNEPGTPMAAIDDPTKDVVIAGTVDTGTVNVKSASATINSATVAPVYAKDGDGVAIDAKDIELSNSTFVGNTDKSSNLIRVTSTDTMTIKDVTFNGTTYNTLMSGQKTTEYLKELNIENCVFDEDCAHINIWFAGFKDDAVLNIKNCTFKTNEQFLCISDFHGSNPDAIGNKLTVNIENCVIKDYQRSETYYPQYSGYILLDDRVCTSASDFLAKKPFANVTINMNNVRTMSPGVPAMDILPGEMPVTVENFKVGTGGVEQSMYVYSARGGLFTPNADNLDCFPTVVIDGTTVNMLEAAQK